MIAWSLLLAAAPAVSALSDGWGAVPVMGYNTYNDVGCSPSDAHSESTLSALVAGGFLAAGYRIFQIDCGWQANERAANGALTYDTKVFPRGIVPISASATRRGFIFGAYTDQGVKACDTDSVYPPGSLGHEKADAELFKSWNASYVKVDNCFVTADANAPKAPRTDFASRYSVISDALRAVGIKGIAICQWGVPFSNKGKLEGPAQWTSPLATSFRLSDDIAKGWGNVMRIYNQAINIHVRGLAGPGHFADMDLLEVGNPGMTAEEQRTHFNIWALFKSPLMISTAVANASRETRATLLNKEIIAINQDPLGAPVQLVQRWSNRFDLFAGPLSGGDQAVLIVDQSGHAQSVTINFASLHIASADVTSIWPGRSAKGAKSYTASLEPHGSIVLRLSNIKKGDAPPRLTSYEAEEGRLGGGAEVAGCSGCSGGKKVGNLLPGASLTFTGVRTSLATTAVRFDFVNCEIGYLSGGGPNNGNVRGASVSVNGGPAQEVVFPISGYEWTTDVYKGFKVELSGFNPKGPNTIEITPSKLTQFAPDIDKIGVVA